MWDLTIHPHRGPASSLALRLVSISLWCSASLLAHCPIFGSDTICNSSSSWLSNIVLFGLSLNVFKTHLLRRGFHTLIKNVSFSSPTDVESHNPPPFEAQRPRERFPHPYKECFVLLPNRCGISQSTSLRGLASSLAHRLVSTPFRA